MVHQGHLSGKMKPAVPRKLGQSLVARGPRIPPSRTVPLSHPLRDAGHRDRPASRSSVPNPGTWNVERPADRPIGAISGLNLHNCAGTAAISGR